MRYKICIVCYKYHLDPKVHLRGVHKAFESKFDVTRHFADNLWPDKVSDIENYSSFDAIIWYVHFRDLKTKESFDWQDYKGLRLMYEEDAFNNFQDIKGVNYDFNCWPEVYRKHNFQALIVTGKKTCNNLIQDGVNAYWIPKGYDDTTIYDKGQPRKGICYYGIKYPARRAMLHYLNKRGILFSRIKCPYDRLNDNLNKFQICLVCNMTGIIKRGIVNKWINFLSPSSMISYKPGPEVMIKNFEIAGSGCVLFCDYIDELNDLGFKDGETVVTYKNFAELVDKINYYSKYPEKLEMISANALKLAVKHTLKYRMNMFEDLFNKLK
ncbi:MAG: glycosyltransferase [Candidatus Omnitrophota bacterium]